MVTLRRELRKKILLILESNITYWEGRGNAETLGEIADMISDSVLGIFFKKEKNR